MKIFFIAVCALFLSFIFGSCKKSGSAAIPSGPVDSLGTGWSRVTIDTDAVFYDIAFQDNNTGYITGKKHYKTVDGGLHWSPVSPTCLCKGTTL